MNMTEQEPQRRLSPGKHPHIDLVLVLGPNGNSGRHMIPQLLGLGYSVCALQCNSQVPAQKGVEVVQGNTLDIDSLKRAVDGADAVCHLIRGSAGPGDNALEKWFNCCMRGAANVLEACRQAPIRRLIAGSADNVFGHTQIRHPGPINERHPKHAADGYYGLLKIVEEELCHQYHLAHQGPVVITRFTLIWTDHVVRESLSGALDVKRQVIHRKLDCDGRLLVRHDAVIDDVVQGILLALEKDVAVGEDFILDGPAPYSSDELAQRIARHLARPIEDQPMPWHSWQLDDSKAHNMLGYRPHHDVLDWVIARLVDAQYYVAPPQLEV